MYTYNGISYSCGSGPMPGAPAGSSYGSRSNQGNLRLGRLDVIACKVGVAMIFIAPIAMLIMNILIP